MNYRKKPVVIQAVQWDGTNASDMLEFITCEYYLENCEFLVITTLEGNMTASPGDWIIKSVKGEFYPCKPDIFEAAYEMC